MISSFIIALREGLEAALIVGILIAYVVKIDKRESLKYIWGGVATAVALSLGLGIVLNLTSTSMSDRHSAAFSGITSLTAVALVTWMVFWMKRTARFLRSDLSGKVDRAVATGPLMLAFAAFLAVVREGLETSLFLFSNFKTIADPLSAAVGLIAGFALAITLGYLIYKRSVNLDLAKFFKFTGIALVIVAAGVLTYAVHEFQELGFLPGGHAYAWNVTSLFTRDSLLGSLLAGTVGFDTTTTWLQLGVYITYLFFVLTPYLSKARTKIAPKTAVSA